MYDFNEKMTFPNRKNDILTVGELLIDMISNEYVSQTEGSTYKEYFGGSPSNIAINAKKLGVRTLVASAVGRDRLGQFLIDQLEREQIDVQGVQQVDYATSLVLLNKSTSSPIPIFYRGADYHLAYTPQLKQSLLDSKIVHFSCWPISQFPVRQTIEQVIEEAKQHDILIGFDPNYHPMIWKEGDDGVAYVKKLLGKVDIVKPSEDDAERLFGKDTHENQIEKFLEFGAKLVIFTIGKDGAIVSNGKETLSFDTLATEVVDTTGAGDAFWSGFYAALIKGQTIKDALQLGFAVSAYKLKYTGAVVDLPKLDVIKQMYHV